MADYSQEELENAMRRFSTDAEGAARVLDALSAAAGDTGRGLRGLENAASSVGGLFKGLASGSGSSLGQFGHGIGNVTKSIGSLADNFGKAGSAISKTINVAMDGVMFVIDEMDQALSVYQSLSQRGYAGAEGIDTLVDNIVEAGMPLKMFSGLLEKNSEKLILLSGSADDSARQFAEVMGFMKNSADQGLRNLGFTTEEIGDTISTFVDLQRRLGFEQMYDQNAISKGAIQLGKEFEEVARLTGASREEQKRSLEQAMRNARFNASQRQLRRQGPEGEEAADKLRQMVLSTSAQFPTLSKAIQDASTGFISSPEAQQMIRTMPGFMNSIMGVRDGSLEVSEAMGNMQSGATTMIDAVESLAMGVGDIGVYQPMSEFSNFITMANGDIESAIINNKEKLDKVFTMDTITGEDGKGEDSTTVELTKAAVNLEKASALATSTILGFETVSGTLKLVTDATYEALYEIERIVNGRDADVGSGQTQNDIDIDTNNATISALNVDLGGYYRTASERELTAPELAEVDKLEKQKAALIRENEGLVRTNEPMTIGRFIQEFARAGKMPGFLGTGAGEYDKNELAAEIERKYQISADTILTPEQMTKLSEILIPTNSSFNFIDYLQSGAGFQQSFDKENWELMKPVMEEIKDSITSSDEASAADVQAKEEVTLLALNEVVTAINTNTKKLDSIQIALNEGNSNTKIIGRHIQVV